MTLTHPLPKGLKINIKAIEKYKDRLVVVYHGVFGLWMRLIDGMPTKTHDWTLKASASQMTFKEALKLTKAYKEESKIEYHFVSKLGEVEKIDLKEFEEEDFYNNPSKIIFDERHTNK